jgi:hypothetical protein
MERKPVDVSLILACYNEESIIEDSVQQIIEVLDSTCFSYEIIFVDDCSQDRTRELIDKIIADNGQVQMSRIFHEKNTGRGGAVSDGFRIAVGDIVGYIDIDLEVHARYIPSCILAIQNGADVATAYRIYAFQWRSLGRYLMSKGYAWLVRRLLGVKLKDTETGFKFFRREKLLPLLDEIEDQHWFWDTEVMVRSQMKGYQIEEIPCLFIRRFDKASKVRPISDTIDYLRNLVRFWTIVRNKGHK